MPAKKGDKVKVHYTGKLEDGTVFDSSKEREPIEFTIGEGEVISAFENAVTGMEEGEEKDIHIPVDEAYGKRNEELIQEVERERFAKDLELKEGQGLQLKTQDGQKILVVVKKITDDKVTLDANHPLAGEDLNFEIKLMEISQAA